MHSQDELDEVYQINILPMIDVIFAILTFFIVSSLYLTRAENIPVNLPKAETASKEKAKKIFVTLDKNNNLYVNRLKIEFDRLRETILNIKEKGNYTSIIINADSSVKHGSVVEILDQIRTFSNLKVGIATGI